jgi:hypothetical protein
LHLQEHSHLFNGLLLLAAPAGLAGEKPTPPTPGHWVNRQHNVFDNFGPAADLTKRLVVRMAALCRARGVDFVVVLHPDRGAFQGDAERISPIESAALESGIRVIDLRRHYRAAGLSYDLIAFDEIGHLTPTGHAFVAEVLREELN